MFAELSPPDLWCLYFPQHLNASWVQQLYSQTSHLPFHLLSPLHTHTYTHKHTQTHTHTHSAAPLFLTGTFSSENFLRNFSPSPVHWAERSLSRSSSSRTDVFTLTSFSSSSSSASSGKFEWTELMKKHFLHFNVMKLCRFVVDEIKTCSFQNSLSCVRRLQDRCWDQFHTHATYLDKCWSGTLSVTSSSQFYTHRVS